MDEEIPTHNTRSALPREYKKGGIYGVSGWTPRDYESLGDFLRQGFRDETDIHDSFDSALEAVYFILGRLEHRDRNSFMLSIEDLEMQKGEGFFQPVYCHRCVEELATSDMDEVEDIEPELRPWTGSYTRKSYLSGSDVKEVKSVEYRCDRHDDVWIRFSETEHL